MDGLRGSAVCTIQMVDISLRRTRPPEEVPDRELESRPCGIQRCMRPKWGCQEAVLGGWGEMGWYSGVWHLQRALDVVRLVLGWAGDWGGPRGCLRLAVYVLA